MADFMMLMKGSETEGDWEVYIKKLIDSGLFRGGSALGNGYSLLKGKEQDCMVTGFMRFEADDISHIRALLAGNPVYEAGGEVELQQLIES